MEKKKCLREQQINLQGVCTTPGITGSQPSSGAAWRKTPNQTKIIQAKQRRGFARCSRMELSRLESTWIHMDHCFHCSDSSRTLWMLLHPNQEHWFGYRNIIKTKYFSSRHLQRVLEKKNTLKVSGFNSFISLEVLVSLWESRPKIPK